MSDWLMLHQLTAEDCRRILTTPPLGPDKGSAGLAAQASGLSPEEVWQNCEAALSEALPMLRPEIKRVATRTVTNFQPDPDRFPRAFTLHDNGGGEPYVSCPWSGKVSDILVVAHEFGHALQVVASADRVLPPATREACAFAGEALLIQHQLKHGSPYAKSLQDLFEAETNRLMGRPAEALRNALTTADAPYDYEWNYPLARAILLHLRRPLPSENLGELFRTKLALTSVAPPALG